MEFLTSSTFLGALLIVVSLTLLIVHGVSPARFTVDWISLALLGIAALPYLSRTMTSLKAGELEVSFRDMPEQDQLFLFLDGVAAKQRWTFFAPRHGESPLGAAFKVLTEELVKRAPARMNDQLRQWLAGDEGQRWFAAEIIGYHEIVDLRQAVRSAPLSKDVDVEWEQWEMNCVWAYSRVEVDRYSSLVEFFRKTRNRANQDWILKAFDQMLEEKSGSDTTLQPMALALVQDVAADPRDGTLPERLSDLRFLCQVAGIASHGGAAAQ
jgi:hypothetical protein